MILALGCMLAIAQAPQEKPPKDAFAFRYNELSLAGLRPGRDKLQQARKMYDGPWLKTAPNEPDAIQIKGNCTGAVLNIEADKSGVIQQIVLSEKDAEEAQKRSFLGPCADLTHSELFTDSPMAKRRVRWVTGRNIALGSTVSELHAAYGDPGAKSPSSKGGQPLELWYYAFDWAGPDVPQVMEVLCTPKKDGKPGRVVEITLAAPSL